MKVLSLFDGMSCGQIALERAGIKVDKYYASEIDKYAIHVANKNYPNMINLGSIIDLTEEQLLEIGEIDLLIGGSPCQGFSLAGKLKGSSTKCGVDVINLEQYLKLKEDNFEFEGQSYLFWEFVRVWKIVKPKYFLLENVRVTKKWLPMFNEAMGVEPIMINSALVSAQNRVRFYWTNIPNVTQPEDKGILLRDILEDGIKMEQLDIPHKDSAIKKIQSMSDDDIFASQLTNSKNFGNAVSGSGKAYTLRTNTPNGIVKRPCVYRKLTPIECERLQTAPDGYTDCVSNSQRYKMLGNGWTVDVVAHIFKGLRIEDE